MGKRVGLLAGLLVLTLGSGVVAQGPSPEPPPWFGGRVEMPEHGFALTFPEGWIVLDPGADDFQEALASADPHRQVAELRTAIVAGAHPPGRDGESPVAWCTVDTFTLLWLFEEVSPEDFLPLLMSDGGDSDFELTYLDLPAGRAAVGEWADGSGYVLKDGDTLVWLSCAGIDPPDDRWLSIAKTFEFLPAEG